MIAAAMVMAEPFFRTHQELRNQDYAIVVHQNASTCFEAHPGETFRNLILVLTAEAGRTTCRDAMSV